MQATNIVTAVFESYPYVVTAVLPQWAYGQILRIEGLELPDYVEAYFTNDRTGGPVSPVIAGADGFPIPDALLETGLPVYCYFELHSGAEDGFMRYWVEIPVVRRPQPSDYDPSEEERTIVGELITALNDGVTRAETAADSAEEDASAAHTDAQTAGEAAETAVAARDAAQISAAAAAEAQAVAVPAAQSAAADAQTAREAAGSAETDAILALESKEAAAQSEISARQDAASASADAQAAALMARSVVFATFGLNAAGELVVNNSERLGSTAFALTAGGNLEVNI